MNALDLDPVRSDAVERELAAIGTSRSRLRRRQRRRRGAVIGAGSFALVGALTAAAVYVASIPGETSIVADDRVASDEHTGSAVIDLGPRPDGANVAVLDITCTAGGTISVPVSPLGGSFAGDGPEGEATTSWDCGDLARDDTTHIEDGLLADGATSIAVTADAGTAWSVTAGYGTASTTDWGVNANGQTYGTPNQHGMPDLQPVQASNGEVGYALTDDLFAKSGQDIDVFLADGETVIGVFPNGVEDDDASQDEEPSE